MMVLAVVCLLGALVIGAAYEALRIVTRAEVRRAARAGDMAARAELERWHP